MTRLGEFANARRVKLTMAARHQSHYVMIETNDKLQYSEGSFATIVVG